MQVTEGASDGSSTGINRSPKQRVPVAPQNGDITAKKIKNKTKNNLLKRMTDKNILLNNGSQ